MGGRPKTNIRMGQIYAKTSHIQSTKATFKSNNGTRFSSDELQNGTNVEPFDIAEPEISKDSVKDLKQDEAVINDFNV